MSPNVSRPNIGDRLKFSTLTLSRSKTSIEPRRPAIRAQYAAAEPLYRQAGDFQKLALPPELLDANIARGTIVVGSDGLWHILYQDRESDRIMSWNTVMP